MFNCIEVSPNEKHEEQTENQKMQRKKKTN